MRQALLLIVLAGCSSERLSDGHREAIGMAEVAATNVLGSRAHLTRLTASPAEMTAVFSADTPRPAPDQRHLPQCVVAYRLREGQPPELIDEIGAVACTREVLALPTCDPLRMARRPTPQPAGVATVEFLGTRGWLVLDPSGRFLADDCS